VVDGWLNDSEPLPYLWFEVAYRLHNMNFHQCSNIIMTLATLTDAASFDATGGRPFSPDNPSASPSFEPPPVSAEPVKTVPPDANVITPDVVDLLVDLEFEVSASEGAEG
jgi:hypothetical protein